MVHFLTLMTTILAALLSSSSEATSAVTIPKGTYFRPTGWDVTGRVNATAKYLRSPCPALNSMANHGLLPRDGKGITRPMLKAAVMDNFNIGEDLADVMVGLSPDAPTFTLATLATHNAIEHDVSLTRRDTYFGGDQSVADPVYLLELLFPRVTGSQISLADVAKLRVKRATACKTTNPECNYGERQQFIANAESGLMLRAMGAKNTESASYQNIYSFFVDETFPTNFVKSETPITFANLTATIESLKTAQA